MNKDKLKAILTLRQKSQMDLAKVLNISQAAISLKICHSEKYPFNEIEKEKIANFLAIDKEILFGNETVEDFISST